MYMREVSSLNPKNCTSRVGDTWLASDFATPVVFDPVNHYVLFFYQLGRKMLGSDANVYMEGQYQKSGEGFSSDAILQDAFFDLQGVFPASPGGG